jgi:nitroreductase
MNIREVICARSSVRCFRNIKIPRNVLIEMLNIVRLAPSGKNAQPWRIIVVEDENVKREIAEASYGQEWIASAPVILVFLGDMEVYLREDLFSAFQTLVDLGIINPGVDDLMDYISKCSEDEVKLARLLNCMLNVAVIIDHLTLLAVDYGLATCWVRRFNASRIRSILKIPDRYVIVALLPLGYSEFKSLPKSRLSVDDIIIKWL